MSVYKDYLAHLFGDPLQCIHTEFRGLRESAEIVRCNRRSEVGFLCSGHDKYLLGCRPPPRLAIRDLDAEIAESIIKTDAAAIATLWKQSKQSRFYANPYQGGRVE